MSDYNFKEVEKSLSSALIDDFRGFLLEGTQRLEVADDDLHALVALEEMEKVPGWKYVSGTGQNPMVELMKVKRAIYITKIPINTEKTEFCRTVGYLKESFSNMANYRSQNQSEYLVLRQIAIGMGYDVDEYELLERKEGQSGTPVSIANFKGDIKIKESPRVTVTCARNISEGDKPVFDSKNNLIGFLKNGKYTKSQDYPRYSKIQHNNREELNRSNEDEDIEL